MIPFREIQMSEYDFNIEGKPVRVNSIQKHKDPDIWDATIFVNESRVTLNAFDDYPPKHFPTERDAVEYAKQAAQYVINRGSHQRNPRVL